MFNRIAERIIDWISGDYELDVEPANHPYYPGETLDSAYSDNNIGDTE